MNTQTMTRPEFEESKQSGGVQMVEEQITREQRPPGSIFVPDKVAGGDRARAKVLERLTHENVLTDTYRLRVLVFQGKPVDFEMVSTCGDFARLGSRIA